MILLISWVAIYIENNSDDEIVVGLSDLGIKIGETFYDYSKISGYTFIYEWERAVIMRLQLIKKGVKTVDLFIDNAIASDLKEVLPHYIQENEKEDLSFTDKMIRLLKL